MKTSFRFILIFILLVCFHLFFSGKFLLVDPPINPDETYFFSISTELKDHGIIRTPIYELGMSSQEVRAYSYPPLFPYLQSFWMMVFGSHLVSIRMLSLVISIFVLLVSYILFITFTQSLWISALSILIIILYSPFAIASRVGRMEIVILLFFMSSLLLITRLPFTRKTVVIVGLLGTFSWLTHPTGFIIFVLVSMYMLVKRPVNITIKTIIIYVSLPFILGTSWWISQYSDYLNIFMEQMNWQLFNKSSKESIVTLLFRTDIVWRTRFLFIMLINSFAILFGVRNKNNTLIILGSISWLMFLSTYIGKEQWYLPYPIFPLILILLSIYSQIHKRWIITSCLFFLVCLNGYTTLTYYVSETKTNDSYRLFVKELSSHIPKDAKILISTLPDPTFELWNLGYKHIQAVTHDTEPNTIGSHLDEFDILLINYTTNTELKTIINTQNFRTIPIQSQGYTTNLIFLH